MFESLRDAFRQALDNFQTELNRDRVPEAADRLLRAMKNELIQLQRQSRELESDLETTQEEARREHEAAKTCLRREEMALRIDDTETASVAREFAAKHLRRHEILDQKAQALEAELDERRRNLEEMTSQFREARLRREALAATAGRSEARDRMEETRGLFDEMDRMAERIGDLEARAEAAREMNESFGELSGEEPEGLSDDDLDQRLEALKRRMNES